MSSITRQQQRKQNVKVNQRNMKRADKSKQTLANAMTTTEFAFENVLHHRPHLTHRTAFVDSEMLNGFLFFCFSVIMPRLRIREGAL